MRSLVLQWPWALALLIAIFPLVWLAVNAHNQRRLMRSRLGGNTEGKWNAKDWLWIGVFVLLTLSLTRPGYQPQRYSIEQSGRDVVFALDVSRSMLARDAYPSRLEAAKQGIRDCLDGFEGEQVGLVIYAGSSSISCPLTTDYDFVRYMLSQIQPRSVEFGGSLLLSAIEKCVDQVLSSERRGFQDIILLTDGEDHGPGIELVARRIEESEAKLLVVGLGDSQSGSRIPILNEEGETIPLKHKGEIVYTRLRDTELGKLEKLSPDGQYIDAGTLPFHLGEIYQSFSQDKERIATGNESGYVIYKEGAFFILPLALLLALIAKSDLRILNGTTISLAILIATAFAPYNLWAGDGDSIEARFSSASEMLEQGAFAGSEIAFGELVEVLESSSTGLANMAASLFNQGLSRLKQAEELTGSSPRDALDVARGAQGLFFEAARYRPDFERAGARLDEVAGMLELLRARVRDEEKREQERDEQIEALLQRIRELRDEQAELRRMVERSDVERRPARPNRFSRSTPNEQAVPDNADAKGKAFAKEQAILRQEGLSVEEEMRSLDVEFSMASALSHDNSSESLQTVMRQPMKLIERALESQKAAEGLLPQWRYWISARARQSEAIDRLQEILDLFASNNEDEGEGDWDEEDWEEFMDTDPGEAVAASMPMKGEFRKDAMMQPLPTPNLSAEDILMEEKSSQQFREQQRAKANAGKVEKDW